MFPEELDALQDPYSSDDISFQIINADHSANDLIIKVKIYIQDGREDDAIQLWTISATRYLKSKLVFEDFHSINLEYDHPLLWEFTDTQCQLYYSGQCNDQPKLFYDLYKVHYRNFQNYKPFDISFGDTFPAVKPFVFSNGLLTQGSRNLMLQYGTCLQENGIPFNLLAERAPQVEGGNERVEQPDFQVLLLGESYIVAQNFSFKRDHYS